MVHSAYSDELIQRDDFSLVKRERLQIGLDFTDELGVLHRTSIKNIEFGKKVAKTQLRGRASTKLRIIWAPQA